MAKASVIRIDSPREAYYPGHELDDLRIMTILTRYCNYRCRDCSADSSTNRYEEEVPIDDLILILEEFEYLWYKEHHITGGEPTWHTGLTEIIQVSKKLGYLTTVFTNGWWINPDNKGETKEYIEETFPEGTIIRPSCDPRHLEQDPYLIEKIEFLEEITTDRNPIRIDGAYDGIEEFSSFYEQYSGRVDLRFCPIEKIGRAKNLKNQEVLTLEELYCPKWKQPGFVVSELGVHYCLRGALNNNSNLQLTDGYEPEQIWKGLDHFEPQFINKRMHKFYKSLEDEEKSNYHHPCDVCEAVGTVKQAVVRIFHTIPEFNYQ